MRFWPRDSDVPFAPPWFRLTLSARLGKRRLRIRSPRRIEWLLLAAALAVSYALSPAPLMIALHLLGVANHPVVDPVVQIVYFPLIFAIEHVPGVDAFYNWYFDLARHATGLPIY